MKEHLEAYLGDVLPFWKKIEGRQRELILHTIRENKFEAGQIMHAGAEECAGMFLVVSGQVRAFIESKEGKEITLYRLQERDLCIFSASCVLRNINFEVFLQAEKETTCYLIPTKVFKELSQESLAVSNYANDLLASRFSDVMWMVEQVLFVSFDKRLAQFLLEQAVFEGSDEFQITQENIARHLGSAREVVSRMLNYFAQEGYVVVGRGKISIVNRKALEELVDF